MPIKKPKELEASQLILSCLFWPQKLPPKSLTVKVRVDMVNGLVARRLMSRIVGEREAVAPLIQTDLAVYFDHI